MPVGVRYLVKVMTSAAASRQIKGFVDDCQSRLYQAMTRCIKVKSDHLGHVSARMSTPERLLDLRTQKLDHLSSRLAHAVDRRVQLSRQSLLKTAGRLMSPAQKLALSRQNLDFAGTRLHRAYTQTLKDRHHRLTRLSQLLEVLSFKSVLGRGFALIRDSAGHPVTSVTALHPREAVTIELKDGVVHSVVEETKEIR